MSLVDTDASGAAAPSAAYRRWQRVFFAAWIVLLVVQVQQARAAGEVRSIGTVGTVSLTVSGVFAAVEAQLAPGHRARRPLIAVSTLFLALAFVGLLTALARHA